MREISAEETVLGFAGSGNAPEAVLCSADRRIEDILPTDSPETLDRLNIRWLIVSPDAFINENQFRKWLEQNRASIMVHEKLVIKAQEGPKDWYVVRRSET